LLTELDIDGLCVKLGVPANGRAVIDRIRTSPPARRVRSKIGNVSGTYPSRKMGWTVQFESLHVELAAVVDMEKDDDVFEYWDQPIEEVQLGWTSRSGRTVRTASTPDFFVIGSDRLGWLEWKTEEWLQRALKRYPGRVELRADGWHCPSAEVYAADRGLTYRLRSSAELNPFLVANWRFLDRFVRNPVLVPDDQRKALVDRVRANPGLTIAELLDVE
jgi:putative transposase